MADEYIEIDAVQGGIIQRIKVLARSTFRPEPVPEMHNPNECMTCLSGHTARCDDYQRDYG